MHIDTDEYVVPSKLFREVEPDYAKIIPISRPGSVLTFLQQAVRKTPTLVNYPCISMLRMFFGAVESTSEEQQKDVPPSYNATMFETLRWRHHSSPRNMTVNGNPKVIIDVSAIPESEFPRDLVFSIHRPIHSYCPRNSDLSYDSFHKQPVSTNHYLGSFERYSGRSDNRRSRTIYDRKVCFCIQLLSLTTTKHSRQSRKEPTMVPGCGFEGLFER